MYDAPWHRTLLATSFPLLYAWSLLVGVVTPVYMIYMINNVLCTINDKHVKIVNAEKIQVRVCTPVLYAWPLLVGVATPNYMINNVLCVVDTFDK